VNDQKKLELEKKLELLLLLRKIKKYSHVHFKFSNEIKMGVYTLKKLTFAYTF
jgi:hypothetical protein